MTAGDTPARLADAEAMLAEARGHHQAGRLLEAERLYKRLAADRPKDAMLLSRLGAALAGQGKLVEALAALERAIEIDDTLVDALNNIAIVHRLQGRVDAAVGTLRRALEIDPGRVTTHVNLGALLRDGGAFDEAAESYRAALAIDGNLAEAHNGLGATLMEQGADDEAEAAFERALAIDAGHADTLNNLGMLKRRLGDLDGAVAFYRRAIAARPRLAEAHINLGNALKNQGALDEAAAALRAALDIDRNYPEAQWRLGQVLLAQGNFDDGWRAYEWRAKCRVFRGQQWDFGKPRWDGATERSKHVLLYAEQRIGDAIQFVRYVPLVAERARRVVVRCPASLTRLFETVAGVAAAGPDIETKTNFHFELPLMSLPAVFGTDAASIPAQVPYLAPPPGHAVDLSGLGPEGVLKVGLVWADNPDRQNDRTRFIDPTLLGPLFDVEGCAFASLQAGPGSEAIIAGAGLSDSLVDLGRGFDDFTDTAAAISALDLVISVDTAEAHLAGALAKPVWTLLPKAPDWRWLTARDDSPWYPTMRLFRQQAAGDWASVIAAVAEALRGRVRERA